MSKLADATIDLFGQAKTQDLPGRNGITSISQPEKGLGNLTSQLLSIAMTIAALNDIN